MLDEQLQTLDQVKATALDMLLRFGPKLLVAALIMLAGHFVARSIGRALGRLLQRLRLEESVRLLLTRLLYLAVLAAFFIMALQNLGIELLPLIAGLGVAGAGVALAMQGLLGNVVAGLTIIFTRPFVVGDYISIGAEEGEVLAISIFSTTLGHTDLSKVLIPNRKIVGEILHNYGSIRQLDLAARLAYGADADRACALIRQVLADNRRVLAEPAPVVGVGSFADSAVIVSIRPWVAVSDYIDARLEINRAVLAAFSAAGLAMPLPQREVRLLAEDA